MGPARRTAPSEESAVRVVIVDDHDMVRDSLRAVLDAGDRLRVVGVAGSATDAVDVVVATKPDVTLLDLQLGGHSGMDVARRLRAEGYTGRILVLSAHSGVADLQGALAAGADGYVIKTSGIAALADSIHRAHAGETVVAPELLDALVTTVRDGDSASVLTSREAEVVTAVAGTEPYADVAARLGVSVRTLHKHVERVFRKLGVRDREALASRARALGLVGDLDVSLHEDRSGG